MPCRQDILASAVTTTEGREYGPSPFWFRAATLQLYWVYAASPVTTALELLEEAETEAVDPDGEGEHEIL